MFKPGLICKKTAGADKGKLCIILESKEDIALIDGETRRRKCNIKHLEPLGATEIKEGASKIDILKTIEASGFKLNKIKAKKKWIKKPKGK